MTSISDPKPFSLRIPRISSSLSLPCVATHPLAYPQITDPKPYQIRPQASNLQPFPAISWHFPDFSQIFFRFLASSSFFSGYRIFPKSPSVFAVFPPYSQRTTDFSDYEPTSSFFFAPLLPICIKTATECIAIHQNKGTDSGNKAVPRAGWHIRNQKLSFLSVHLGFQRPGQKRGEPPSLLCSGQKTLSA